MPRQPLKSFMQDWLHAPDQRNGKPIDTFRQFEQAVRQTRELMFLRYDIPGVRYWQPPGQSCPFPTAPGQMHGRTDVVELTRVEFLSRFGDPDDL